MNEVDDYNVVIVDLSAVCLKNPTIIVGFTRFTLSGVCMYVSGEVLLPILYNEIFIRTNMLPTTYKYD